MGETFRVRHFDSIGSTSDEARRLAVEGAPSGTVVHADEQTAGRGRLTRNWFSPPGNLYMSVLLRTGTPSFRNGELSFLTAVAVAQTVETLLPRRLRPILKWPNDVLVNGAKIAGILLDAQDDAVIIGIGLNVLEAPANASYKTTTIVANGGIASVDSARDILLDRLGKLLSLWQAQGFAPVRAAWLERSYPEGATIRVNNQGESISGVFAGLDQNGALLLETPAGVQRVVAGDVSAV
jgi:BirA family biotin operon repressor/biotin-[acetyl-CoA-carboxylase] ligase